VVVGGACTSLVTFMQWLQVRKKRDRSLKRFLRPLLRTMSLLYWAWFLDALQCWGVVPYGLATQVLVLLLTDAITISLPIALVLISLHFLSALSPNGGFNQIPLALWALLNITVLLVLDGLTAIQDLNWYRGLLYYWVLIAMWVAVIMSWRKVYNLSAVFRIRDEAAFAPGELVLRRYLYFLVATTIAVIVASVPWVWLGYIRISHRDLAFRGEHVDVGSVVFAALQCLCLLGVSIWMAPHDSDDLTDAYEPLVPP